MEYLKGNREYVNGESFIYMGRDYTLEIIVDKTYKKNQVELFSDRLYIYSDIDDKDKIRLALLKWYNEKSLEKVRESVVYYQKYFDQVPNKVMVKEQKKAMGDLVRVSVIFILIGRLLWHHPQCLIIS